MTTDNEIKLPHHVTDQDENELRVHRTTRPGRAWVRVGQGNDHRSVYVAPEKVERLCRAIYLATGLEWPAQVTAACRAMYSPGENTRYDCTRARNHRGPHLDDTQNTLWFTGWDPDGHGYRLVDGRSDADRMRQDPARPIHWCGASLPTTKSKGPAICADVYGHSGEHGKMWWPEGQAAPKGVTVGMEPESAGQSRSLCGQQLVWDRETGGTAQCVHSAGHDGLHGLGHQSGDYLSGRYVEDVLSELLRRVSIVEKRSVGDGFRQTEPVTSRDDMESVSRTNHRTEIIGLLEEIRDRLPEPMVTLPTCGDLRPGSHPMEFCQETGDHTRHRNGTSTWPRPHRGPGDLNRSV